jgi:hypothetical protein
VGETLLLVQEATGPRHVLAGRPLHPGAVLELFVVDGHWVRGTYQWSFDLDEPAHLVVDEPWGPHWVTLDDESILRLPVSR